MNAINPQLAKQIIEKIQADKAQKAKTASLEAWNQHLCDQAGYGEAPAHQKYLNSKLELLSTSSLSNLAICMPPSYGKTETVNVHFVPYHMMRHPGCKVMVVSNNVKLARSFSVKLQDIIRSNASLLGYDLRADFQGKDEWQTTNGCSYLTLGLTSSINGRRADLIIVDDPYRNNDDAQNPDTRDKVWRWFIGSARSRGVASGDTKIVVVHTRFHEEDLIGELIRREGTVDAVFDKETGEHGIWDLVRFPALAEEGDVLGRKPGEHLWPERITLKKTLATRNTTSVRDWISTYQQRPAPEEGFSFEVEKIGRVSANLDTSQIDRVIRAWDLAAKVDGDWTAGLKLASMKDGTFTILDVVRFRGKPHEVRQRILDVAKQDGIGTTISLPQDPAQAGLAQKEDFIRLLAGYSLIIKPASGDKVTRASPVASQVGFSKFHMVDASWNHDLRDELLMFPSGKYDDQVDALSSAFNDLMASRKRTAGSRPFNLFGF